MNYEDNKEILRELYTRKGISANFEKDSHYLEEAFYKITETWLANLSQIQEVKYLMIAEAPLWGRKESYIYNPDTQNTQFFHKGDLEFVLNNIKIHDKQDFISRCNGIGLLIIDISPFALNTEYTTINYRPKSQSNPYGIAKEEYRQLVETTLPTFFECKIKAIAPKVSSEVRVFFRYARVKDTFRDIIAETLISYKIIESPDDISDVSQQGGGIDRAKFSQIIHSGNQLK